MTTIGNPLIDKLRDAGARFSQLEHTDQNGIVRGKIGSLEEAETGGAMSNLIFCTRSDEDIVMTPFAQLEVGFEKYTVVPDHDTLFQMPWRPDTVAVIGDMVYNDGSPCLFDPRQILKAVVRKYEELGYTIKVGAEFEFRLLENDDDLQRNFKVRDLKSVGRNRYAYSLRRTPNLRPFVSQLFARMEAAGAPLEVFHTEYAQGMYEVSFEPNSAIGAADGLARLKTYLPELADEYGYHTTNMVALDREATDTSTGVHLNISIQDSDGNNAFWDQDKSALSELGTHFGAGVVDTMGDAHVIFRPWINSYRRFDPDAFCPVHQAWAQKSHLISLRLVHGLKPEKYTRWEHRVSGTDTCQYLVLAAILLGGLYGIENKLDLPMEGTMDRLEDPDLPMLSNSLELATETFKNSARMREFFGDEFVEHFAQIREEEIAVYEAWKKENNIESDPNDTTVTDWEYRHYYDWL